MTALVSGLKVFFLARGRRTAEEDGEGFVENLGGVRVEDVASLQLPWSGSGVGSAFVVLISARTRFPR